MIQLNLLARHFKDTEFICDCAIDKAAKEHFNTECLENVSYLAVNRGGYLEIFRHDKYGVISFKEDMNLATAAGFDDTIIRTIKLHETT